MLRSLYVLECGNRFGMILSLCVTFATTKEGRAGKGSAVECLFGQTEQIYNVHCRCNSPSVCLSAAKPKSWPNWLPTYKKSVNFQGKKLNK